MDRLKKNQGHERRDCVLNPGLYLSASKKERKVKIVFPGKQNMDRFFSGSVT